MPNAQNFFALCRTDEGLVAKRIPVTNALQDELAALFQGQEQAFRSGVSGEVEFAGDWKPDDDELLTIDVSDEAKVMLGAVSANTLSAPALDTNNFIGENVKAIFTGAPHGNGHKVLVQKFSAQQSLGKKLAILLTGNSFKQLTEPAFTMDTRLVCIIEGGKIKFRSFHNLRMIIDLSEHFEEATDDDIDDFADHSVLEIADIQAFKDHADQTVRKLVHKIMKARVLDQHTAEEIEAKASEVELELTINGGKVVLPEEKQDIKQVLCFLDDGLYEAPLSGQRYVTNSKRRI